MARIGAPLGVTLLELELQAAPAVHALVEAALVITHDFFPRAACITVAVPPHSPLSAYRAPREHRNRPALHTRTEKRCGRWAASSPAAPVRALDASLPTSPGSSARYAPPTARDASWQHVCICACATSHSPWHLCPFSMTLSRKTPDGVGGADEPEHSRPSPPRQRRLPSAAPLPGFALPATCLPMCRELPR